MIGVAGHSLKVTDIVSAEGDFRVCVTISDDVDLYVPRQSLWDSCKYTCYDNRGMCDIANIIVEVTGEMSPCAEDPKAMEDYNVAIRAATSAPTTGPSVTRSNTYRWN